ncbi:MAG: response regulator transcription factor [Actinomycetota bacterium]|nr:response regulator transcription factor [Actinomycetota bacterium]
MRILVVDDEPAVRSSLQRALVQAGYEVALASDGRDALAAIGDDGADAVVLDVMMPGLDGIEVTRTLRRMGDQTPLLLLTARQGVSDRVAGLDAGADDYLTKPFVLEELLARVRALLRRSVTEAQTELQVEDLSIDLDAHRATRGGRPLDLTRTEFSLLELFMRNPGRVLSRSHIYEQVWGYDFGPSSNSLDVYVGYLRRKTEAASEPRLVQTVRGVGFVLRPSG